ncbi:MAG: glycosyltransferase [Thermoanaerobaculales bacterium]|nr:glycosyltransferase [Thermoanaerobaculales bacterium]
MTLRVLHVLNDLRGGATMSAVALMKEGLRQGSDIEHYAVDPGREGARDPRLEGVAKDWSGVPIRTWHRQSWTSPIVFRRLIRAQISAGFGVRSRNSLMSVVKTWGIGLIHTNTAIVADGARVALERGIPHVWHVRERIGAGGFKEFPIGDRKLARFIANSSARVPVISTFVQEFFTRNGQEQATQLVYDGVDLSGLQGEGVKAGGRALREQWGVPEGAVLVGMVGGLKTRVKRHDLFLEMAREVLDHQADTYFVIVGELPPESERGPNTLVGRVLSQADELGLSERVVFSGHIGDMAAVWAAMDIYVHLCDVEGFSRAILEAMGTSTSVVAVAAGGNTEAVIDQENGLLVPRGGASGYASAVRGLVDDPELRDRLGQAASRGVQGRFSIEAHYNTMKRVFVEAAFGTDAGAGASA